ncbi:Uncharacterized protein FKW44_009243 [Caligus rogercresseyi]|uniref:Uncharacterized protein n=1 Tax=Caligus rogercresseyi TaxID=217165 RepID=A0A7T8HF07_CALRO|nr:Uncharacterized protein FKW44_009242 [Caligus rogercresseyi]QQP48813.1 Uncharacterized protein FKW44_009243 [Caligus rogercresseyi]|eukprot:TRINITY_DN14537_c0_g1_i1.p1 TRINITY_DN14537_c0_g1~~TRINITY_DN14537_c0_g1_i1.p1  ORF type:complete len:150 (+),score=36.20 TRINITY_DN14537_c0_g1_i1:55-450(+)
MSFSAPLEDTPAVKEAKATFQAAYDDATAGRHAELAPEPVMDAVEVSKAKKEFDVLFKKAKEAGVGQPFAYPPQGFAYSSNPYQALSYPPQTLYHHPLPIGGYIIQPVVYYAFPRPPFFQNRVIKPAVEKE